MDEMNKSKKYRMDWFEYPIIMSYYRQKQNSRRIVKQCESIALILYMLYLVLCI